ncbi:hypothetical protein ACTGYZ_12415, partial [Streptococcus suis]
ARAAVLVTAGFVLLMGATAQAAPAAGGGSRSDHAGPEETVKPAKHRRHAGRRSGGKVARPSADQPAARQTSSEVDRAIIGAVPPASSQLPPEV